MSFYYDNGTGVTEIQVSETDIRLQDTDDNETKWEASLSITNPDGTAGDPMEVLSGIEGYLGFGVTVLDKAGNQREIRFSDDGTIGNALVQGLVQQSLEGEGDYETENPEYRARVDSKLPEVTSISLHSSNPATNMDYSDSVLVREGDTVTLKFETSERISTHEDYQAEVSFISGANGEFTFSADEIRAQASDTSGLKWEASLELSDSEINTNLMNDLSETEGYLGFEVKVFDRSGNERIVKFIDNGNSLTQLLPEAAEVLAQNTSGKRARVDTKAPEVESIALHSSNGGLNEDDFGKSRLLSFDDTVTLEFETSERISTLSDLEGIQKPSVSFFYKDKELSVRDENITLQGLEDEASEELMKLMDDLSEVEEEIADLDYYILKMEAMIEILDSELSEKTAAISRGNLDLENYQEQLTQEQGLETPDPVKIQNLTQQVAEVTDEIAKNSAELSEIHAEHDESSNRLAAAELQIDGLRQTRLGISNQIAELEEGIKWQAELKIDREDFKDDAGGYLHEEGYLGFKVTVLDKAGNQRVIEFEDDQQDKSETSLAQKSLDGEGDYKTDNPTGYRARLDTKLPEIESITLHSSNQGTNLDFPKSLLFHHNDNISLEFVTSERISTSSDQSGNLQPKVHFISGTKELSVADGDIEPQPLDSSGTRWIARLEINESEPGLSDKEDYLGFKVKVFDKSGNERIIQFSDDGTILTQVLPEAAVVIALNTSGKRARLDTKRPEVLKVGLASSNLEENEDYPDTRLARIGDTLTLSFETSERISDLEDVEGERKPRVSFYYDNGTGVTEIQVSETDIRLQDTDDNETKWEASLSITNPDGTAGDPMEVLSGIEGYLGFGVTVLDKAGNQREIRFSDDGTIGNALVQGLVQQSLEGEGDYETENPEYRARVDSKLPEVTSISLHSSNPATNMDYSDSVLVREGDTVTLKFETSERISTHEDYQAEVSFISGANGEFTFSADEIRAQASDTSGLKWEASLELSDSEINTNLMNDLSETEGYLGFEVKVFDRSGNERIVKFIDNGNSLTQLLPEAAEVLAQNTSGKRARVDTKAPEVESIALHSSNGGLNEDDFGKSRLLSFDDTVTLEFETSERISTLSDLEGIQKPSVSFFYKDKELSVRDENITLQGLEDEASEELMKLMDDLSEVEEEIADLDYYILKMEAMIEILDSELSEKTAAISRGNLDLENYQEQLTQEQGLETPDPVKIQNLTQQVAEVTDEIAKNSAELSEIHAEHDESSNRLAAAELQIDGLRQTRLGISNQIAELEEGIKWQAELKIDREDFKDDAGGYLHEEGYLGFKVTVLDKAGNQRVIEFEDAQVEGESLTSLAQKSLDGEGDYETDNPTGYRARLDTKLPELLNFELLSSNAGTSLSYPLTRLLRHEDTLSLQFETDERISVKTDLGGIRKPEVYFISGTDEIRASDSDITLRDSDSTGREWVAEISINENPENVVFDSSAEVSTLAGSGAEGSSDGTGTSATFDTPYGMVTDGTHLYVAEYGNHQIRRIEISSGEVTTLAGSGAEGSSDGTGTSASFK